MVDIHTAHTPGGTSESAVLAEVGEAEGCRSEAVFLLFCADVDQHEDRHDVGNHLRELHRVVRHRDADERRLTGRQVAKMTSATASQPRASMELLVAQVP